jgi:hypothetical protein
MPCKKAFPTGARRCEHTKGTFHGLGALDKWLQSAAKLGLERVPVRNRGTNEFVYADTGKPRSVQEALYYFFGLPIQTIPQPAGSYSCHRTPGIV